MESNDIHRLFQPLDAVALTEIVLILAGAFALITAQQRLLPWAAQRLHGRYRHVVLASVPLLRLVILGVALILVVPVAIEPSWQNMTALLGATGLALGFALKDYISSLIAGVVSAFERPYRPGDWVEIDGIYGEVVHVGMRSVVLVTPDDDSVTIPHLKLWNAPVKNANNGSPLLQCSAVFNVHPDHDARRAREALEDVALTSPYLQMRAPVAVVVRELDWGTQYRIRAYPVDPRQQFRFTSDLTVRGREALRQMGAQALLPPAEVPVLRGASVTGRRA